MSLPKLRRILAATSFRLTLTYACLFVAGTLIPLFVGGFVLMAVFEGELEDEVEEEIEELQVLYREAGLPELLEAIGDRAGNADESGISYGLFSDAPGSGERAALAGNLPLPASEPSWFEPGWFEFVPPGEEDDELSRGQAVELTDQLWLIVAANLEPVDDTWEVMLGGIGWTLGVSLPLALICGAVLSAMVLRRIEAINQTTLKIRDGGMNSRVPVEGRDDEFDRLSAHINAMLDSIQVLTGNVQQVSIGIAHDLRTPLSRVYYRLEALKSGPPAMDPPSQDRLVQTVDGALAEIGALIETFDALLRIGQIEAGTRRAGFEPLDLSELLAELAETYEVMASEGGKSLTAEIDQGCRIRGDRALLVQMVANVVENAIEHTPAGAAIALKLRGSTDAARLTVWDSGPGIPEDEHENVFKRFYRLDRSRGSRGNGLGLSIVRSVATLHAMEIHLFNDPTGFNIEFSFPLSPLL